MPLMWCQTTWLIDPHPRTVASTSFLRPRSLDTDYFRSIYLATDERSNEAIRIFQESGIKLFNDLVTTDDRREFGWPLLFSDVIALVEQQGKLLCSSAQ
jgi:hypothetical protein